MFCLAYLVPYLAYLVFGGLFGVHYIFFCVFGICGIGILYLLHLEFGMVHLIFSLQKNAQILRSLWKKVRRFEKGTPPSVVAVVTIIRCEPKIEKSKKLFQILTVAWNLSETLSDKSDI